MINCLLVEDQTLLRLGLVNLLNLEPSINVSGQASDGVEALQKLSEAHFDIVLLDMRMPNLDGLGVLEAMQQRGDNTPVLIITTFEDCDVLVKAINLGAKGYVLKNIELEAFIGAINTVISGQLVLQDAVTHYLLNQQNTQSYHLTAKELSVLRCMSLGMANKAIARHLDNSEGTIRNHVSQVIAKLAVSGRTQAVIKAIQNQLV